MPQMSMPLGIKETAAFFVVLGMMGSSYFVGFKPIQEQRQALITDMDQKKVALENLRASLLVVANMQKKLDDLSKSIQFFDARLPRDKDIKPIIESIWKIAEKHGLSADRMKTLRVDQGPNYLEQPIELELTGDFKGFYQFLLDIERISRITRVGKIDLKQNEKDPTRVQIKLTLSIYYTMAQSSGVAAVR